MSKSVCVCLFLLGRRRALSKNVMFLCVFWVKLKSVVFLCVFARSKRENVEKCRVFVCFLGKVEKCRVFVCFWFLCVFCLVEGGKCRKVSCLSKVSCFCVFSG